MNCEYDELGPVSKLNSLDGKENLPPNKPENASKNGPKLTKSYKAALMGPQECVGQTGQSSVLQPSNGGSQPQDTKQKPMTKTKSKK